MRNIASLWREGSLPAFPREPGCCNAVAKAPVQTTVSECAGTDADQMLTYLTTYQAHERHRASRFPRAPMSNKRCNSRLGMTRCADCRLLEDNAGIPGAGPDAAHRDVNLKCGNGVLDGQQSALPDRHTRLAGYLIAQFAFTASRLMQPRIASPIRSNRTCPVGVAVSHGHLAEVVGRDGYQRISGVDHAHDGLLGVPPHAPQMRRAGMRWANSRMTLNGARRAEQSSRIEPSHAQIVEKSANEPGLLGGDLPPARSYTDLTSDIFTVARVRRR